jgi:hypothetical protein
MKIHARPGFTGSLLAFAMLALAACAPESADPASPDTASPVTQSSATTLAEAVGVASQAITCANKASVSGHVVGQGGVGLQYAHIQVRYSAGGYVTDTFAGGAGAFGPILLDGGVYDFTVSYPGYPTKVYSNAGIGCGQIINETVQM